MSQERRSLEKDCHELDLAVRKAFMLTLSAYHQEQKRKEAAAWQTAWIHWNTSFEDSDLQSPAADSASSRMGL